MGTIRIKQRCMGLRVDSDSLDGRGRRDRLVAISTHTLHLQTHTRALRRVLEERGSSGDLVISNTFRNSADNGDDGTKALLTRKSLHDAGMLIAPLIFRPSSRSTFEGHFNFLVTKEWAERLKKAPFSQVYEVSSTPLTLPDGTVVFEVKVPADGSCMYHSLWLAWLLRRLEDIGLEHMPHHFDEHYLDMDADEGYDSASTVDLCDGSVEAGQDMDADDDDPPPLASSESKSEESERDDDADGVDEEADEGDEEADEGDEEADLGKGDEADASDDEAAAKPAPMPKDGDQDGDGDPPPLADSEPEESEPEDDADDVDEEADEGDEEADLGKGDEAENDDEAAAKPAPTEDKPAPAAKDVKPAPAPKAPKAPKDKPAPAPKPPKAPKDKPAPVASKSFEFMFGSKPLDIPAFTDSLGGPGAGSTKDVAWSGSKSKNVDLPREALLKEGGPPWILYPKPVPVSLFNNALLKCVEPSRMLAPMMRVTFDPLPKDKSLLHTRKPRLPGVFVVGVLFAGGLKKTSRLNAGYAIVAVDAATRDAHPELLDDGMLQMVNLASIEPSHSPSAMITKNLSIARTTRAQGSRLQPSRCSPN